MGIGGEPNGAPVSALPGASDTRSVVPPIFVRRSDVYRTPVINFSVSAILHSPFAKTAADFERWSDDVKVVVLNSAERLPE